MIGEEGRGLQQALVTLDGGRIGIGALSIGLAQAALEYASGYAKERQAFGQPIANYEAIQWMLADAATEIEAARMMIQRAAWLKQEGRPYTVEEGEMIDWIDPETAEVKPVDGIQHAVMSHCALQPDFVDEHTAMVEAVFRLFLANGNQPMSAEDLSDKLKRPAVTILRTLSGARIYRGLRPFGLSRLEEIPADEASKVDMPL